MHVRGEGVLASSSWGKTYVKGRHRGLPHASGIWRCSPSLSAAGHLPCSRADGTRRVSFLLSCCRSPSRRWHGRRWAQLYVTCSFGRAGPRCASFTLGGVSSHSERRASPSSCCFSGVGRTQPTPLQRSLTGAKQSKKFPKFL